MTLGRRPVLPMALAAALAASMPARAEGARSRELKFPGAGGVTLAGTLVLPDRPQKVPGVVLIAGSGPTDRDGNNPGIPVKIDLLKQIEIGRASCRERV